MVEHGVFHPEARLELVNGELVDMSPIGAHHAFVVRELNRLLAPQLAGQAVVSVQSPLRCDDRSEPQPDVAVLDWPPDRYFDQHPTAADTLLVIEVADSSLHLDSEVKMPLYGRSGIHEAWLVDLSGKSVTVYTDPKDSGYGSRLERRLGDVLRPTKLPDVELSVADLGLDW